MRTKPNGLDADWVRYLLRYVGGAHARVYEATGGRVGGRLGIPFVLPTVPILLLEHVGRRSGAGFTTPLVYLEDGTDVVVVASQGGRPQHPQWYRNLVAGPDVTIRVGRERRPVRARTASPAERARLWPRLVELYADFDSYQSWTEREIPVVVLSRITGFGSQPTTGDNGRHGRPTRPAGHAGAPRGVRPAGVGRCRRRRRPDHGDRRPRRGQGDRGR